MLEMSAGTYTSGQRPMSTHLLYCLENVLRIFLCIPRSCSTVVRVLSRSFRSKYTIQ